MNIKKYIAFLHTVESGNITQSARELGYTQSAVSKMIADLESEWKTKLLVRSNDGVQLTSDGIALLPLIQAVVRDYRNLNFMVSEMHHMEAGLLRLGCFTSFSVGLLPKILKDFREHYPHIAIQLFHGEYGDLTEYLQRGVVDCAFLAMPAAPGLEVKFLLQETFILHQVNIQGIVVVGKTVRHNFQIPELRRKTPERLNQAGIAVYFHIQR